mmetsp:Transcript_99817/g.281807  ORF Transcript_99817/g.281807 Transcript_99817/m.281807 type:complete len:271 (-) Transcript_99817:317-1129(-)
MASRCLTATHLLSIMCLECASNTLSTVSTAANFTNAKPREVPSGSRLMSTLSTWPNFAKCAQTLSSVVDFRSPPTNTTLAFSFFFRSFDAASFILLRSFSSPRGAGAGCVVGFWPGASTGVCDDVAAGATPGLGELVLFATAVAAVSAPCSKAVLGTSIMGIMPMPIMQAICICCCIAAMWFKPTPGIHGAGTAMPGVLGNMPPVVALIGLMELAMPGPVGAMPATGAPTMAPLGHMPPIMTFPAHMPLGIAPMRLVAVVLGSPGMPPLA